MAKVYRVCFGEEYQSLEPTDYATYSQARRSTWKFDGYPVEGKWEKLNVYARETTLRKPDIWQLVNTMALEIDAADKLKYSLAHAGQQFKLPFEDRRLVVVNVTYVIDALDTEKTTFFDKDLPHIIEDYVFHKDRLDYSLFKIPQTQHGEILTVEGLASHEEEFKPLIEKLGIKGLSFRELWSSD